MPAPINDPVARTGVFAAVHLQADGSHRHLTEDEYFSFVTQEGLLWMHLDRRSAAVQTWLSEHSGLETIDVDALLSEETRPRAYRSRHGQSLLVILRGVNNTPDFDVDADRNELVSIRIWVEKHRVISLSSRPLAPVNDVQDLLGTEYSPRNGAELLAAMATAMVTRMEPVIDRFRDALDVVEEMQEDGKQVDIHELLRVRRLAANLRRFLGPQKDVFLTIQALHVPWIDITAEEEWREASNTTFRYIEELDAVRDRIGIVNEGINARAAARASRTLEAVSIVAGFFVPFTFVTGLMGMNVGGIPFSQHPHGFSFMLGGLAIWALVQTLIFRRLRWL